jgi:hypothetical protein
MINPQVHYSSRIEYQLVSTSRVLPKSTRMSLYAHSYHPKLIAWTTDNVAACSVNIQCMKCFWLSDARSTCCTQLPWTTHESKQPFILRRRFSNITTPQPINQYIYIYLLSRTTDDVTNISTRVRIGCRIYSLWRFTTATQVTITMISLALLASQIPLTELHWTEVSLWELIASASGGWLTLILETDWRRVTSEADGRGLTNSLLLSTI